MHSEWYSVSQETADLINATRAAGHRVIAVGDHQLPHVGSRMGPIRQDHTVQRQHGYFHLSGVWNCTAIDGLITNFHLPESTLIMLISAFYGYEKDDGGLPGGGGGALPFLQLWRRHADPVNGALTGRDTFFYNIR